MTSNPSVQEDAGSRMLQMLNAFLTMQALYAAAALGIADQLTNGPKSVDDLAADVGAHGPSLYRLLRMLAGVNVFREEGDGRFAQTALSQTLCSDGPNSVRDWALYLGAPEMWEVWGGLRDSVTTGEPSIARTHGMPLWEYLAKQPAIGTPFNRWMSRQSELHNAAIVANYDFSQFRVVADIGGGQGSTIAAILEANPKLEGILLDLPWVIEHPAPLAAAQVMDRCTVIGGDMLLEIPPGADAYLIKRVLMNWGDAQATGILHNCATAMGEGGKVLAVEIVLPPGNEPSPGKAFDLLMLLNHADGRMRTETEFRTLFASAGLRLTRIISTASPNSIIEGVRT